MATKIFGNDYIVIQTWSRQDSTAPAASLGDAIPPFTKLSFWLRNDPSMGGEILLHRRANDGQPIEPPPWPQALFCHVLAEPPTRRSRPVSDADPTWSTKVGTTLLYDDSIVNVWDFIVHPLASCHYHVHHYPYVFINLVPGATQPVDAHGTLLDDGPVRKHGPGEINFVDVAALDSLPHHAFRNVADTPFCQYIVEFKEKRRD
ncbi:hypothetical protein H310_02678 [Aphanomyces invadans]|uniref:Uncharacterized protein n=1 Tax=Aphanomyces invadans TaxID=157072 RepID=A0A024UJU6_9STRA|nr:hypothetical protein H310_02678 [Aphanomyces invadans]ETW06415.1 hypothetical protein H310_02678 [Aphanomyces invadans]|eukprot:XP_008864490.1 hypothetical protein H310_02678 [Aphanomyces invadans]